MSRKSKRSSTRNETARALAIPTQATPQAARESVLVELPPMPQSMPQSMDGVTPNVVGSARDYFQLADRMRHANRPDLEIAMIEQSIAAAKIGAAMSSYVPGLPTRDGMGFDLSSPLIKGVVANAMAPKGTKNRMSEALLHLGAYQGIREPEEASRLTMEYIGRICKMPLPQAIIRDRVHRSRPYCTPSFAKNEPGWRIRQRDRKAPVTRGAQKMIDTLSTLLEHGGFPTIGKTPRVDSYGQPGVWDGLQQERAHGIAELVPRLMHGLATYDWAPFRMEAGSVARKCPIAFIRALDPPSVVQVEPSLYPPTLDTSGLPIHLIERWPEAFGSREYSVVREYPWSDCAVIVENERTDWMGRGYGCPAVEILLNTLSVVALSEKFQRNYLDDNFLPAGFLSITGSVWDNVEMREMLQQMMMLNSGPEAFWRIMTLFFTGTSPGDGAKFEPLRSATGGTSEITAMLSQNSENRALICAVFGIAPEVLGFESHSVKGASLNSSDPQSKFDNSLDKAFIPPMTLLEAAFSNKIIGRFDMDFVFEFVNLDPKNTAAEEELATKLMTRGFSMNQVADLRDEERIYVPMLRDMYTEIESKLDVEDYDTRDEYEKEVRKKYEKAFRKKVPDETISAWAKFVDEPVMCAGAMQSLQMQQQTLAQALAPKPEPGASGAVDPSQMVAPGAQAQGEPPLGPDGQPIDPNDPFGHGQDPQQSDPNNPQSAGGFEAPQDGGEDDEENAMYGKAARRPSAFAKAIESSMDGKPLNGKPLRLGVRLGGGEVT